MQQSDLLHNQNFIFVKKSMTLSEVLLKVEALHGNVKLGMYIILHYNK